MKRFLVIMPHYYGKGDTIDLAFKEITKISGSRRRTPRLVYEFDSTKTPQCYVSEMGDLTWEGEKPVLIERKGIK